MAIISKSFVPLSRNRWSIFLTEEDYRRVASAKGKAKAKPKGRPAAKARAGLPPGVLKLAKTTSPADLLWGLYLQIRRIQRGAGAASAEL